MAEERIDFLCDQRACDAMCWECRHTSDINHALNFANINGSYYENIPAEAQKRNPLQNPFWTEDMERAERNSKISFWVSVTAVIVSVIIRLLKN